MNKKQLVQIIFFGAIWGIIEASLGYVLHFIPAAIAGSIMFPIVGIILYRAYNVTESKAALVYIAFVAALIKSVNFLLPQISIYKTINPMMSIVMEALLVVVVISMVTSQNPGRKFAAMPIASIGWRTLFIAWMTYQYLTTGNLAPYISTTSAIIGFIVIEGLISGLFGSVLVFVNDTLAFSLPNVSHKISYATFLFAAALLLTYTL